jgi:hypothetical protein
LTLTSTLQRRANPRFDVVNSLAIRLCNTGRLEQDLILLNCNSPALFEKVRYKKADGSELLA